MVGGDPATGVPSEPASLLEDLQLGCANAVAFTLKPGSVFSSQSVELAGSSSWSPWYAGPPVHWLVTTRRRTCVAFVCGTSNERMISSGARGRGTPDGNASAGLVKIRVNCESCEQFTAPFASHAQISNCRSAVKRFWPPGSFASFVLTRSMALTWTRRTWCDACEGSSRTVTCFPAPRP